MSLPDAITAADGALENAWFTGVDETNANELIERYRARFGTVPTSEAIAAHDAAGLLAAALVTPDPVKFLHAPRSFLGILGKELAVVELNTFQPPLALKRVVKSALVQENSKPSE
jgi:ABC-type branched-subunit amino acid transport system substrate-binding protein